MKLMTKLFACAVVAFIPRVSLGASPTLTTFTVPGGLLTPTAINDALSVAGYYVVEGVYEGFLRTADGTLTTISAPGAGTGVSQGTLPYTMNNAGTIAGAYVDAGGLRHGFILLSDGMFTSYDVSGATETVIQSINASGVSTGFYIGGEDMRGFYRYSNGYTFTFGVPDAESTAGYSINESGTISGTYTSFVLPGYQGFVRARNGVYTLINMPEGVSLNPQVSINADGTVCGTYGDSTNTGHGFALSPSGVVTTFDAPGGGAGLSKGTFVSGLSSSGAIVGTVFGAAQKAFVRTSNGTIEEFFSLQTAGLAINNAGSVAGTLVNGADTFGYVLVPSQGQGTEVGP